MFVSSQLITLALPFNSTFKKNQKQSRNRVSDDFLVRNKSVRIGFYHGLECQQIEMNIKHNNFDIDLKTEKAN